VHPAAQKRWKLVRQTWWLASTRVPVQCVTHGPLWAVRDQLVNKTFSFVVGLDIETEKLKPPQPGLA